MKVNVTIALEISDAYQMETIEQIIKTGLGSSSVVESIKEAPAEEKPETKKPAAKKPAAKKPAKKKEEPKAAAPKVSETELKKAVSTAIAQTSVNEVREVFSRFKGKDGNPCAKMSDVKPSDYAALVEALA